MRYEVFSCNVDLFYGMEGMLRKDENSGKTVNGTVYDDPFLRSATGHMLAAANEPKSPSMNADAGKDIVSDILNAARQWHEQAKREAACEIESRLPAIAKVKGEAAARHVKDYLRSMEQKDYSAATTSLVKSMTAAGNHLVQHPLEAISASFDDALTNLRTPAGVPRCPTQSR